jgi:hypothetical protein
MEPFMELPENRAGAVSFTTAPIAGCTSPVKATIVGQALVLGELVLVPHGPRRLFRGRTASRLSLVHRTTPLRHSRSTACWFTLLAAR